MTNSTIARSSGFTVTWTLLAREMLRFRRQPARVIAAIGTPLLLWFLLASGFTSSFTPIGAESGSYSVFLLPGMMVLTAVFTAIFSTISIIDDRNEGWLQSVLASPAPRWSVAMGKILGGAVVAFMQSALLLALAPLIGVALDPMRLSLTLLALMLTAIAMTGLGSMFAWRCETTQGFHAVMNLVIMPMWLLSGAFFPVGGAAGWLSVVMRLNPLTWCTEAVRGSMNGSPVAFSFIIAGLFAVVMVIASTAVASRPMRR